MTQHIQTPERTSDQEELDARLHASRMQKLKGPFVLKTLFMHWSALKETSRKEHVERHGKLFSANEMRKFWATPENRMGCTCSVIPVLVDSNGVPLLPAVSEGADDAYNKMKLRFGPDWPYAS